MTQKKRFRFVRKNAGDTDILSIEIDDPKLRPLALVLTELWFASPEKVERAIAEHGGYEIHGAGFAYDGKGFVDIFRDEQEARVTEVFFEQLVLAYGREARGFSP
jgi:hypothetical protein